MTGRSGMEQYSQLSTALQSVSPPSVEDAREGSTVALWRRRNALEAT